MDFKTSLNALSEKMEGWLEAFIVNVPNIILAIVVYFISYYLSRKLSQFIKKLIKNKIKQESIRNLIGNFVSIFIIAIGLFLALTVLNLDKALTSILAGAGVAGLAIGLALQGTIANTFSGIFLAVKDILNVGDFVETNGYKGTVENINLRYLTIKEADNNLVIIPNSLVVDKPFKNFGLTSKIRVTLKCGVSYDSDLKKVKNIAVKTIDKAFPQEDKEIEFHFLEFGDSSINFQLRFWVDARQKKTAIEAKSDAIILLKEAFEASDIDIPYPTRTIINAATPKLQVAEVSENMN